MALQVNRYPQVQPTYVPQYNATLPIQPVQADPYSQVQPTSYPQPQPTQIPGQPVILGGSYPAAPLAPTIRKVSGAPLKKGGTAPKGSPSMTERRRRMAEAFLQQGMDTSPIASPWQGAARLAEALVGGWGMHKADQQEQAGMDQSNAALQQMMSNGGQISPEALGSFMSNPWASPGQQAIAAKMWEIQNPGPQKGEVAFDNYYQQYVQDATKAGQEVKPRTFMRDLFMGHDPNLATGGGELFQGKSPEATGLNYLIQQGQLTPQQAAEVAAGKTVVDPQSGASFFFTPQGLAGQLPGQPPQTIIPPQGGQIQPPQGQNLPPGAHQITGPRKPTEAEIKGNSIYAGAKDSYDVAMANFDALNQKSGQIGDYLGVPGNYLQSKEYQIATDAMRNILQNYVYALSGQQAPEQEVTRNLKLVAPELGDKPERIAEKKKRLNSFMNTIRVRAQLEAKGMVNPGEALPLPKGWSADEWGALEPQDQARVLELTQ